MALLALVLSLAVVGFGLFAVISPQGLLRVLRRMQTTRGLLLMATIRIVYGAALFSAGPTSASPQAIRGLGVFVVIAGLVTPFFGVERFRALTDAIFGRGDGPVRIWALAAVAFGGLVASQIRV